MNYENLKERLAELRAYVTLIQDNKDINAELRYAIKAIEIIIENLISDK